MAYGAALDILQTLTGSATAAGTVGLALGLFICAHPAANAVNILIL
jgi:Trk-type K+ transport system membrane component